MKLCIVRHGLAVTGADSDEQRPLREEGVQQAQRAGQWLESLGLESPQLMVSPYLRTQQTAQAINESLGSTIDTMNALVPSSAPESVVEQLLAVKQDTVLVSHLPLVGRLAALLVEGQVFDQPWSPAECWLLEGDIAAAACMSVRDIWYPELAQAS
ncbi:phosphohistidine phosphatase SixA [Bacterioplanes sanyensis]|uniref:Phosphohistidine phosphatase SixA n=1 Tax=Bacterioplanes sanyensis TaxID=1249553 RepID=A0A222FM42_9GAMM|nr:phosphohistidine phosphatase SixA [Bacterioplanes sanyensis]ASP39742.1 phosphohistidine phosphatase SixA [Bacterioplanes sanyensis]